jgi:hypothetical protein
MEAAKAARRVSTVGAVTSVGKRQLNHVHETRVNFSVNVLPREAFITKSELEKLAGGQAKRD